MPFELLNAAPQRIAVIGAGISGMGAAHYLADHNHVVMFEAAPRLGGHARTVMAGKRDDQPVDTGFIVFNRVNYPHLVKLFETLDVPIADSNMSFGASINGGALEYGLRSFNSVFAQKKNMANPKFLRMLWDINTFNRRAVDVANDPEMTIGDFLRKLGTGAWFRDFYILPLSGAIWSTPTHGILDFPAQTMVQFFKNHALLSATGQHPWFTVKGGSVEYVRRLAASLEQRGVDIRLSAPIQQITRDGVGVTIKAKGGVPERFDQVILATHSDDSLAMLGDPSPEETAALGAVRYQPNQVVLHCDDTMMPRSRQAWASWAYTEPAGPRNDRIDLTYWMNSLQPIPHDDPLFVTLNSKRPIDPAKIYDQVEFRHPVYDLAALQGQKDVRRFNGANNTWYCGAWMRNGFHEDGLASAYDVAERIARAGVAVA
ncbi:NAD(P)/FAD-dependent oxidoreductase [Oceaniglobus ichthyenteri]|uniref:NAD(P)/FAD-dependent oxidoreductase n=1 Tax=Oceaniglobus ichthyenteri TaxID=2136177 RepID=UPI000D366FCF|nr:FAD-dependent oxidoreductase [Oceaniglobus ichthyenteri]